MNKLINEISSTTIEEFNSTYACMLYKGHHKDKSSSRAYRTISTWPVLAKGIDMYVCDLSKEAWKKDQSETQFQGEGSSHELAAVLLTE